jgi:hypothetical protein
VKKLLASLLFLPLFSFGQGHYPLAGANDTLDEPNTRTAGRDYYSTIPRLLQPSDKVYKSYVDSILYANLLNIDTQNYYRIDAYNRTKPAGLSNTSPGFARVNDSIIFNAFRAVATPVHAGVPSRIVGRYFNENSKVWGDTFFIYTSIYDNSNLAVGNAPDGSIIIAFRRFDNTFTTIDNGTIRSTDGGATWSAYTVLTVVGEPTGMVPFGPVLTRPGGKTVFTMYKENVGKVYIMESSDNGVSFTSQHLAVDTSIYVGEPWLIDHPDGRSIIIIRDTRTSETGQWQYNSLDGITYSFKGITNLTFNQLNQSSCPVGAVLDTTNNQLIVIATRRKRQSLATWPVDRTTKRDSVMLFIQDFDDAFASQQAYTLKHAFLRPWPTFNRMYGYPVISPTKYGYLVLFADIFGNTSDNENSSLFEFDIKKINTLGKYLDNSSRFNAVATINPYNKGFDMVALPYAFPEYPDSAQRGSFNMDFIVKNRNLGLGIDQTTPIGRLHIQSSSGTPQIYIEPQALVSQKNTIQFRGDHLYLYDSFGTQRQLDQQSPANAWLLGGQVIGANSTLGSTDNFAVGLLSNNIERVRLTSNGKLLIGTTTDNGLGDTVQVMGRVNAGTMTIGRNGIIKRVGTTLKTVTNAAEFTNAGATTGMLVIKHATLSSATMFDFRVKLFNTNGLLADYRFSIYKNTATTISAASKTGVVLYSGTFQSSLVRAGFDGSGNLSVMLGDTATAWVGQTRVIVEEIVSSNSGGGQATWEDGWSITNETSLIGYTSVTDVGVNSVYALPETFQTNTVATTNATVTTIATIPLPTSGGYATVTVDMTGKSTNDYYRGIKTILIYNNAGTLSVVGAIADMITPVSTVALATATFSITTSGTNILVRVTGVAATNISWLGIVKYKIN